jgi:hypothetical protein
MFSIDYDKFLLQLLPSFLRKSKRFALLKTMVYPVKQVYQWFTNFRNDRLYNLNHNGQRYSIENVLNDRFDPVERRIYNTDGFTKDRIYIYGTLENKPIILLAVIFGSDDYSDTGVDTIVWVPNGIIISTDEMIELRSLIENYKIASKRFKVQRV